jgi:outer membrane autotransporter protein
VLDLGLADVKGSGPGGGALVNAPLIAGTPGQELSMFAVSGVTRLSHEGYRSSSSLPGGNGMTPEFDETDVGLTLGVRWDASRHFDLDKGNLTFGVIANYTHTDIDLGTNDVLSEFFDRTGSVDVDSWSLGTYGLITDGRKYGLLTVTGTFGAPQTENYVFGSTADYDTAGVAVSAMSGVLVPMGATTLDLRGGFNFIHASADDYTDSAGLRFSDAELEEISGTVSARLFRLVKLEDGSFRPFIQSGLTQRLHYSNEVDVEGVTFSFDDADTTVFARAGVDFDIDSFLQAYVAVRGDASESMEAIAAQVGLTFKLD